MSCRCSWDSSTTFTRERCSSAGKPSSSARCASRLQHFVALPGCSQRRSISSTPPPWSTPPSSFSVPCSMSPRPGMQPRDLRLATMAVLWFLVSRDQTLRKPESSSRSLSRWELINFTCECFSRSMASSATSATLPQRSSSSRLTTRSGRETGSMEHSEKTWSQSCTKPRNCRSRPSPAAFGGLPGAGAKSFTTFCRKRWKSRRLDSKLRSARLAWVSTDLATQASSWATVSWYLLLSSSLALWISACFVSRSSSYCRIVLMKYMRQKETKISGRKRPWQ
mmetsp:Transcript_29896/g.92047  ORF Transcript_29896/g.92047 Transcript_29896/m.92047 type:complete len:280 (-) Transcript_29896:348-1187(-)